MNRLDVSESGERLTDLFDAVPRAVEHKGLVARGHPALGCQIAQEPYRSAT